MHTGRIVFSQLMDFLPMYEFNKCVHQYRGNQRVRSFSCLDQFLCMAFAQLTYRESLRDIETCLRAMNPKLYHAGIRGKVSRSTLADANEKRPWQIYADFAQVLIQLARPLYVGDDFGVELKHTAYALDATTIDLCLSLFPWAKFRKRKGAVKLHTLLDLRGNLPTTVIITHGKVHEVNILDQLPIEPGAIYVMDRGYVDFARLYKIVRASAFYVIRAKNNFDFRRLYSYPVDKQAGVQCDQTILLNGFYPSKEYPDKLRRIRYFDARNQQAFCFFDQPLQPLSIDDCKPLPTTMANRIVLQMDQTTPADQSLLWDLRECGEDTNLDRNLGVCARGHRQEAPQTQKKPLHNSTGFEPHPFRENPHFTGSFANRLHKPGEPRL